MGLFTRQLLSFVLQTWYGVGGLWLGCGWEQEGTGVRERLTKYQLWPMSNYTSNFGVSCSTESGLTSHTIRHIWWHSGAFLI